MLAPTRAVASRAFSPPASCGRTPHGFGSNKLAEKFDKWIGVTNTARNRNTVLKVGELGRAAEAE